MNNKNTTPALFVLYDEEMKKFFVGRNKYSTQKKYAKVYMPSKANLKIEEMKEEGITLTKQPIGEDGNA